jgi:hypothetical protein
MRITTRSNSTDRSSTALAPGRRRAVRWRGYASTALLVLLACSVDDEPLGADLTSAGKADEPNLDDTDGSVATAVSHRVFDRQWLSSIDGSQTADAAIDLGEGPFAQVRLRVEIESPCYPLDKWEQSPPPPGHNFPVYCDRFDRFFNIAANPPEASEGGAGSGFAFELLRGATPYGGPLTVEQDITDWANAHPGEHVLRSYVSTSYDTEGKVSGARGGYFISASLEITKGPAPRRVLAMTQLWNGPIKADTGTLELPFTVPDGTRSASLHYLTSGHGTAPADAGCTGHADEFCKREHKLALDGTPLALLVPWRDDCGQTCTPIERIFPDGERYTACAENPQRAIANARYPRANWCPAERVEPIELEIPPDAREHELQLGIAGIAGGNANWPTSITFVAYGD